MKNKLKPLIKEAKKTAQKAIHQSLIIQLKETVAKFSSASKKMDKKIEKEAKKLAKKLVKDVKIDESSLVKEPKSLEAPKVQEPIAVTKPAATKNNVKQPVAKIAAS